MSTARWWPRRASDLPPGQRLLDVMPRFADDPRRPPPPVPPAPTLTVTYGERTVTLTLDDLAELGVVERTTDFHCVTTWSVRELRWAGVPIDVVLDLVDPDRTAPFAVGKGADGVAARFVMDDLRADDVVVATHLAGTPLDLRHGAPLRLVCPSQYGYKSVKHLTHIELVDEEPSGSYGPKEHLRGRVAHQERHERLPAWLVRWPYRVAIGPTVWVAERTLRRAKTWS